MKIINTKELCRVEKKVEKISLRLERVVQSRSYMCSVLKLFLLKKESCFGQIIRDLRCYNNFEN